MAKPSQQNIKHPVTIATVLAALISNDKFFSKLLSALRHFACGSIYFKTESEDRRLLLPCEGFEPSRKDALK